MSPKHFVALAAAAALSLAVALIVYASSTPWSRATPGGAALFETLQGKPPEIARIEVEQAGNKLTLERKGQDWLLKERQSFPATAEKVRAFLLSLAKAELVEAKTRKADRHALLALEDPALSTANSRLVRLIDDKGQTVAEAVIGKTRTDAFGSGKTGTYVRRPGEDQTWLASTEIEAGTDLRAWVKPRLFETRARDIKELTIDIPGEQQLKIALAPDGQEHLLQDIPEGKKIKYVNSIDDIAEAASSFDFDDVRKLDGAPAGEGVSTLTLELANGVRCVFRIRPDGGVAWFTMDASGSGDAAKAAEALNARTKGWEFRIPKSKADAILKRRADLLEDIAS